MHLKFKKINENAKLPSYATKNSSGMDLYTCIDEAVCLHAGESAIVPTGVSIQLPDGLEAQVRGHAGLAFRHAVFCFQDTIDADNDGEIKVLLTNQSKKDFVIHPDMKVAQLVVSAQAVICRAEFDEGNAEVDAVRGNKVKMAEYVAPQFRKGAPDQGEIMDNLLNAGRGK